MQSPPDSPAHNLQGASCVTGGFARGRAVGNVFNFADGVDIKSDPPEIYCKGKVLLYDTNGDMDKIKPKLSMKHEVISTLGPILSTLKKRYPKIYGVFQ
jgi:hypothetical protein